MISGDIIATASQSGCARIMQIRQCMAERHLSQCLPPRKCKVSDSDAGDDNDVVEAEAGDLSLIEPSAAPGL